jgi:hypothetical protein
LKRLIAIALAVCACAPLHAREQTSVDWCYQYLLATWKPHETLNIWKARQTLTPVLEGIAADPTRQNVIALDHVAQFVLDHLDDDQLTKDEAKELVGALARTRSGRYRLVMAKVHESQRPKVITLMAGEYVREHKLKTVDQYVPGTIDFASLRAGYPAAALAVPATEDRARKLVTMTKFGSIDEVFALMGPPQHVEALHFRFSETIKYSRLLLYYRGAGRAVFGLDDGGTWLFQAAVADPLAFEALMPYRERAAEFGLPDDESIRMAQLISQSLPAMRLVLEDSYHLVQVPVEFLDTTAEILAQNWKLPGDDISEDIHAWMIRLLTTKGGPRYAPLLTQIADETKSLKLRKWALLTVKKPAGIPRVHYVIGSVVLADQAKKFPSPYPGVTYTNGRL